MIETFIKHLILDTSLVRFFDSLIGNFGFLRNKIKDHEIGDWLKLQIVLTSNASVELRLCKVVYKSDTTIKIECHDFQKPFTIVIEDEAIIDLIGVGEEMYGEFLRQNNYARHIN